MMSRLLRASTVLAGSLAGPGCLWAPEELPGPTLAGDLTPVHDPAIVRQGDRYYLFSTSHVGQVPGLVHIRISEDLTRWRLVGAVFPELPEWATRRVPGTRGLWAPDVLRADGEYRLYYSVSTFGRNNSAIGLAVTPTLDAAAAGYAWVDKGPVFGSRPDDDFNAIDPNVFVAADGSHWISVRLLRLLLPRCRQHLPHRSGAIRCGNGPVPRPRRRPHARRRGLGGAACRSGRQRALRRPRSCGHPARWGSGLHRSPAPRTSIGW